MKKIKNTFNLVTIGSMILDVIFIMLALFLLSNPSVGVSSALLLIGVVLVVSGLYSIVKYILNNKSLFKFELIYGILSTVVGLIALFRPFAIVNFFTILIGIWLFISSVFKLAIALELKKYNIESWTFDMGISVLTIILGLMLMINPFDGYMVLTSYVAILIIMYSGMDIVEQVFIRRRASKIFKFLSKVKEC